MYILHHVPTGTDLATFKRSFEVWVWLRDNPSYDPNDLILREYHHITDHKVAAK